MSLPSLQQYHRKPYEAICPSRPELSQAGKTILVTGGNSGIGYAIARNFIKAGAKRVIILGRRPSVVKAATEKLAQEAKAFGSSTIADGRVCDIASLESTEALWTGLQHDGIYIDVLVLNAAAHGNAVPILKNGLKNVWADYEANVRSSLDFAERFYKQTGKGADSRKFLINLSSIVSYMWSTMAPERPSYGVTKNAGTALVQQIAKDTDVNDMQIVSFHPGGVLTDMARAAGASEDIGIPFDDENLPGQFAVWAASREAEYLHGRFVWANWDVDEVKAVLGKQIAEEPNFLKVGIEGLSENLPNPMIPPEMLEKILQFQKDLQSKRN
ncbi:NAD(P)-binding protein [Trichoderma citrinoviride]|uniref:NAD(P)-binding protein n=1 Tax=Trichoderma citrinoviride TaxID=58853 RepID=A0A2T4BKC8_9HYPO|nr:NAD(P)-binding protein [Trichoderma citrinoviride]PTB69721.1 NAD(P)-binding protein [Trichoderma citrinoviride]